MAEAARTLRPTMLRLTWVRGWSHGNPGEETGARITGVVHWFPVSATSVLTFSAWHRTRGQKAMKEMGLLPDDTGRAIPDREQ